MQREETLSGFIVSQYNKNTKWIILLVVLTTTFVAYYPGLFAGFELRDDHVLIRLAHDLSVHEPVHVQVPPRSDLVSDLLGKGNYVGRLFPLGLLVTYISALNFGLDLFKFHVVLMGYALLTSMLLYFAASRILGTFLLGGIFSIWILQAPDTVTWVHLSRGEHLGMVFLSGCLYCIARARKDYETNCWDWIGLVCFACATLSKEMFLLVMPALLYMRVYLRNGLDAESVSVSWKSLKAIILSYAIWTLFILLMVVMSFVASGERNVGLLPNTGILNLFRALLGPGGIVCGIPRYSVWFLPIIGLVLWHLSAVLQRNPKRYYEKYKHIAVFMFLWIVPLAMIYSVRGGMFGRYWLPMLIGLCLPNAIALKALLQEKSARKICIVVCVLLSLWMARCIQINWSQSVNFANRTHALEDMVRDVVANVPDDGIVVIAGMPSDRAYTVVHYLGMYGKPHVKAYLFRPDGEDVKHVYCFVGRTSPGVLNSNDIDAVIYLKPEYKSIVEKQSWYNPEKFHLHDSFVKQNFFSIRKMSWVSFDYGFQCDLVKPPG